MDDLQSWRKKEMRRAIPPPPYSFEVLGMGLSE